MYTVCSYSLRFHLIIDQYISKPSLIRTYVRFSYFDKFFCRGYWCACAYAVRLPNVRLNASITSLLASTLSNAVADSISMPHRGWIKSPPTPFGVFSVSNFNCLLINLRISGLKPWSPPQRVQSFPFLRSWYFSRVVHGTGSKGRNCDVDCGLSTFRRVSVLLGYRGDVFGGLEVWRRSLKLWPIVWTLRLLLQGSDDLRIRSLIN